jgi:hypothetical protein
MNISMLMGPQGPLYTTRKIQLKAPLFADSVKVTAAEQIRRYYAQTSKTPLDRQQVRELILRRAGNRSA